MSKTNSRFKKIAAVIVIFLSSSIVPFGTYQAFKNTFALAPEKFWRFTPTLIVHTIPMSWIVATIIANIIIAFVAVWAYVVFHKAVQGSWLKKGLVFGGFATFLGVFVPVWSVYTLTNMPAIAAVCFALDGAFEYMLYSLLIAYVLKGRE